MATSSGATPEYMAYADAVRKATPTLRRPELRVVEHAIPPLWKEFESEMTE